MQRRHLLALTCLMILGSVVAVAAQGTNSLQGRVISPEGRQPANPVKITLTFNGRRVYEVFTDLSGRYSFSGLVRGTYQLLAEGDGHTFEDTMVRADIFGGSGQLFNQDIHLRQIRGKPASARAGVVDAFSQDVPKKARDKFELAQQSASKGKGEQVLAQLDDAIKIFPRYFDAHLMRGNYLLQTGRLDEAIPALDHAREINPNDERVYQSFGLLLMRQRKYPVAVAVFQEASRLNPGNPANSIMQASALIYQAATVEPEKEMERNGLLKQADLALSKAGELSDKKAKLDSMTLAMFYELKGEPSRAASELEDYLKKTPGTKHSEAIQKEISRLRSKNTNKTTP